MYISKIDELLDNSINEFHNFLMEDKTFKKILGSENFVKHQKFINELFEIFMQKINVEDIEELTSNQTHTEIIIELIKRYNAFYLFMLIAYHYKDKRELYINNLIEFTKSQGSYNYRITNFFNGENNGYVIRFFTMVRAIEDLMRADRDRYEEAIKNPEYKDTVNFLNNFDPEFIRNTFKRNRNETQDVQALNIIKTLIIMELYIANDKEYVLEILNTNDKEEGEFIYIDIVVPKMEFMDFASIEAGLSQEDIDAGIARTIHDFIIEQEDLDRKKAMTAEQKIGVLLENNIIIPIVEDFMLYHKETEKYDSTGINIDKDRSKEDGHLKYIVSKIDNFSELNSNQVKSSKNLLTQLERMIYTPLSDRDAILINELEDNKIIARAMEDGRSSVENNEYLNDLLSYRAYPYINYKEFKNDGFKTSVRKTIPAIRSTTITKQMLRGRKESQIQLRIGSGNQILNMVGLMIKPHDMIIDCIKIQDLVDIRKLGSKNEIKEDLKNGYNQTMRYLKNKILKEKELNKGVYWMFDTSTDKTVVEGYEHRINDDKEHNMRIVVSSIYDDILNIMFVKIKNKIKEFNGQMSMQQFDKIVKDIETDYFPFPRDITLWNELYSYAIYDKVVKVDFKYDNRDDKFPGLFGDIIKLPVASDPVVPELPILQINLNKKNTNALIDIEDNSENMGAICQHLQTWENITALRKKRPNEFQDKIFEFVANYVLVNYAGDYICKSCGRVINIKNYVLSGSYNSDGNYVMYHSEMVVPLEDIPEYSKYDMVISSIDKMIERIASISNINFLQESTKSKSSFRKQMIKNAIDLISLHNKFLRGIYYDRKDTIKKMGIKLDLTNYFYFELENSIFIHSSKDRDQLKPIKRNNILVYLFFLILMEFNNAQIIYMSGNKIDKTCNYTFFAKYGYKLFENIKIRKNMAGEIVDIQNYKVLCYLIFQISCSLTKYKMWKIEGNDEKSKKFNPIVQKKIIHTLLDLINSVLHIAEKNKSDHIYEIVSTKFYEKLATLFKDSSILKKIRNIENKKRSLHSGNKTLQNTVYSTVAIGDGYKVGDYQGVHKYPTCSNSVHTINKRDIDTYIYQLPNDITHCPDGQFHNWKPKGTTMECTICGAILDNINTNKNNVNIIEQYRYQVLRRKVAKYCKSGELHNFIVSTEKHCDICSKCNVTKNEELTEKDLDEISINIGEMQVKYDRDLLEETENVENQFKLKFKNDQSIVKEIHNKMNKGKNDPHNNFWFIDKFVNTLEKVIGENININNENRYLKYNSYYINHDYRGYEIKEGFYLNENDNKIKMMKNHPYWKRDVLYYTNNRLNLDVYYDAYSYLMLGYKERAKVMKHAEKNGVFMKVNYSLINILRMFGYDSHYIDISEDIEKIKNEFKITDEKTILEIVIKNSSRSRTKKLKQIMNEIHKYINRILYNYKIPKYDYKDGKRDKSFILIEQYSNKLRRMKTGEGENSFMKQWNALEETIIPNNTINKPVNLSIDNVYVNYDDMSIYDTNGQIILYYLVEQMENLMNINTDKFVRAELAKYLINILLQIHYQTHKDDKMTNYNLRRHDFLMNYTNGKYVLDFKTEVYEKQTEGIYDEYVDPDDKIIEDEIEETEENYESEEEMLGFDIDMQNDNDENDMDYQIDYES